MSSLSNNTSIKSALLASSLLITSIALLLYFTISGYTQFKQQQHKTVSHLSAIVEISAEYAKSSLLKNDRMAQDFQLASLKFIPSIKNVHIFKWQGGNSEFEFFASFNNPDTGPLAPQLERLNQLINQKTPLISDEMVEMSRLIKYEDQIIGILYIRGSLQDGNNEEYLQIFRNTVLLILALLVSLMIATLLQRFFLNPLSELLQLMHLVAKEKRYHHRAPSYKLQEFNLLSKSFNTLMERIENQLQKSQEDELEIKELNQNLENTIALRTQALRESNQELLNTLATLHQYQQQIIETEKMASLGQMVAGIAHEVNTPIGLGVTASTLMLDKLTEIERAFQQKTLTSSQMARFLSDGNENLNIIYRNLERAAGLISSFKQVAVDQSHENMRNVNMLQLINEVLLSLRPNIKKTAHHIAVECPDELTIFSKPGPLNQILINLVMNSLQHAFPDGVAGIIKIQVAIDDERCQILYEDNGQGVPEQIRKRIFDPFVTTKRGQGGSGLGLHLVYNLVTQALNGKISLETSLGKGLKFIIEFPLKSANSSDSKLNAVNPAN